MQSHELRSQTAWVRSKLVLPIEGHLRASWHLLVRVHRIRVHLRFRHERRLELAADEVVDREVVQLEERVRPDLVLTSRARSDAARRLAMEQSL